MQPSTTSSCDTYTDSVPIIATTSQLPDRVLGEIDTASNLISRVDFCVPVLSVIIPVFNEVETIMLVVNSVAALKVSKQIIIVDDGSTDGTHEIVNSLEGNHDWQLGILLGASHLGVLVVCTRATQCCGWRWTICFLRARVARTKSRGPD